MEKLIKSLMSIVSVVKGKEAQKEVIMTVMKASMGGKVGKALDASALGLIDQIAGIIDQLAQMSGGTIEQTALEGDGTPAPAPAPVENTDEPDPEEDINKEANNTTGAEGAGGGTTGADNAEERISGDLPENDQEAASDIAKSLLEMVGGNKVNKTNQSVVGSDVNTQLLLSTIKSLTNVVAEVRKSQSDQQNVIEDMMQASGATEQLNIIHKAEEEKKVNKEKGAGMNSEMVEVMKGIGNNLALLSGNQVNKQGNYQPVGHTTATPQRNELAKSINGLFDKSITADPTIGK